MTQAITPPKRKQKRLLMGDLTDFQERPLEMLLDIANNYGPVITIRFGPITQTVLTHPDAVRHVLQQNNPPANLLIKTRFWVIRYQPTPC